MGLLDGLEALGIKNISAEDIYKEEPKEVKKAENTVVQKKTTVDEKDLIFPKKTQCPICDNVINHMTVKSGRARLLSSGRDLRPIYDGIEPIKYEMIVCQNCGYAVMGRFLGPLAPTQRKLIIENISQTYKSAPEPSGVIPFELALQRIQLTLVSAVVKKAKASEKAYICLKGGYLCESFLDDLDPSDEDYEIYKEEITKKKKEFMDSAYEGLIQARANESFPIAGMDEITVDYILAVLALDKGELDVSSKMVAKVLQSTTASSRIKDKARDLKAELVTLINARKSAK